MYKTIFLTVLLVATSSSQTKNLSNKPVANIEAIPNNPDDQEKTNSSKENPPKEATKLDEKDDQSQTRNVKQDNEKMLNQWQKTEQEIPKNAKFHYRQANLADGQLYHKNYALKGLLIPGLDMYLLNKKAWAGFYFGAKFLTGFMMYGTLKSYQFWSSAAKSASFVQQADPAVVLFKDPDNNENQITLATLENRRQVAFLNFVFSTVLQLTLFTVNYFHVLTIERSIEARFKPIYKITAVKYLNNTTIKYNHFLGFEFKYRFI